MNVASPLLLHDNLFAGGLNRKQFVSTIDAVKRAIVVLDDEPLVLAGVSMLLEAMGHEVTQAATGEDVLLALQTGQRFDLGIFDLAIRNGQGGLKIVAEVGRIDSAMKLVVTSGNAADDAFLNFQKHGFDSCLPKPFSRLQLTEVIDRLFE